MVHRRVCPEGTGVVRPVAPEAVGRPGLIVALPYNRDKSPLEYSHTEAVIVSSIHILTRLSIVESSLIRLIT